MVQHYTQAGSGRALAKWLQTADVSVHLVGCRDGHVIQMLDFEHEGIHAGEYNDSGFWQDKPQIDNANHFTIGIENSNYGWLIRDDENKFWIPKKTSKGYAMWKPYRGPAPMRAADHLGQERYWEPYTDQIVQANVEMLKRIGDLYPHLTREDVQGHSDVSPHRKFDPGPLWPGDYVLDEVFGKGAAGIHSLASNVLVGGPGDPDEDEDERELFDVRDYYDEDSGMCIDPALED